MLHLGYHRFLFFVLLSFSLFCFGEREWVQLEMPQVYGYDSLKIARIVSPLMQGDKLLLALAEDGTPLLLHLDGFKQLRVTPFWYSWSQEQLSAQVRSVEEIQLLDSAIVGSTAENYAFLMAWPLQDDSWSVLLLEVQASHLGGYPQVKKTILWTGLSDGDVQPERFRILRTSKRTSNPIYFDSHSDIEVIHLQDDGRKTVLERKRVSSSDTLYEFPKLDAHESLVSSKSDLATVSGLNINALLLPPNGKKIPAYHGLTYEKLRYLDASEKCPHPLVSGWEGVVTLVKKSRLWPFSSRYKLHLYQLDKQEILESRSFKLSDNDFRFASHSKKIAVVAVTKNNREKIRIFDKKHLGVPTKSQPFSQIASLGHRVWREKDRFFVIARLEPDSPWQLWQQEPEMFHLEASNDFKEGPVLPFQDWDPVTHSIQLYSFESNFLLCLQNKASGASRLFYFVHSQGFSEIIKGKVVDSSPSELVWNPDKLPQTTQQQKELLQLLSEDGTFSVLDLAQGQLYPGKAILPQGDSRYDLAPLVVIPDMDAQDDGFASVMVFTPDHAPEKLVLPEDFQPDSLTVNRSGDFWGVSKTGQVYFTRNS